MRWSGWFVGAAVAGLMAPVLYANDHSNLDRNRPLRLEDPYPVSEGEVVVEMGAGMTFERKAPNRGLLTGEALYGIFPNAQVSIASTFSSSPHSVGGPEKSGDVQLSALYNFNQEALSWPAFGLKTTVNLPSGVDSNGADVELKALVTKSIGRLSLHMNAAYTFVTGEERGEREGRYELVLGASYPLGAPVHTLTSLVWDVFTKQSDLRGERNVTGAEVGIRHQLGTQSVIDVGVGSEIVGPPVRSPFYFTTGISISF